ncbi:carbamoyl phosphate synthase large subunit [bacterium LRH843]|nr:carbamoyl phosphate synthase large subunit [bacterium LRH843]
MPRKKEINKVLVIGSGPIVIGQAAEFDYAGTQACLALKEEGIEVILINNNPATVMTDEACADRVYFEPLTVESVEAIIKQEKPDGILATLGGQTGLNLAMDLHDQGILDRCNVRLLGTPIESIKQGEDREAFRNLMKELNEPVPESDIVTTKEAALAFADLVGYPIIVRPAYTLGGAGGGIAYNEADLKRIIKGGLSLSPISQCLIEKSIAGFKEIEYEVMRDSNDTCITICNIENIDPVGVHTGDSIVVAPSQTMTDEEHQMLRTVSIKIIRALGIVGGCNIQFALDPYSKQYYLIEVNPRVSRSSALASKATGYPIARMTAKVSLGYHLHELINPITGQTYASFEPALDYVVVKFPRWPFDKFVHAERSLGTQMKATGEVMAIERNLCAAIQKAVRSLELKIDGLVLPALSKKTDDELWQLATQPDDRRFFVMLELMRRGASRKQLHEATEVNEFFLQTFERLISLEKEINETTFEKVDEFFLKKCKQAGFSDAWLASKWNISERTVREKRKQLAIVPSYKLVDSCAGEYEANAAYFYSSWSGESDVLPQSGKKKLLLLGSGPIRIGQGIEFDYCSVQGIKSLHRLGYEAIMMNNNPETVSTDYATADRLYFEPLTVEDVLNVIDVEQVDGVIVQLGGQTAISLVEGLEEAGVNILGTNLDTIDQLEDRGRFYTFMKEVNVPHIPGVTANNQEEALNLANEIGYPVLIRPSYVIGGQGMMLFQSEAEFTSYLADEEQVISFPILIDAYYQGIELDVDALTDGENITIAGMFEHVERAGVHSGDSIAVTPPHTISDEVKKLIKTYTKQIAKGMNFRGIFNIQFVLHEGTLYVIEINPRASRTVPILSKITNEPLIDYTVQLLLGVSLSSLGINEEIISEPTFYTVKAPIFSYQKLSGLDPLLEAEMKSTGELMSMSHSLDEAFYKVFAWSQSKPKLYTHKGSIFIDVASEFEAAFKPFQEQLQALGFDLITDSFDEWVQLDEAIALISLPKLGTKDGKEKRQEALRQRCTVISEMSTLDAMLRGLRTENLQYSAIQDWWNKEQTVIL